MGRSVGILVAQKRGRMLEPALVNGLVFSAAASNTHHEGQQHGKDFHDEEPVRGGRWQEAGG